MDVDGGAAIGNGWRSPAQVLEAAPKVLRRAGRWAV
jgi:hypothetical protein